MDQDAPSLSVVPPIAWETTRKVGFLGLALTGAAAILGLVASAIGDVPSLLHTVRLGLVLVGAITAGLAISFRPELGQVWLIGAGASLLAAFGVPSHWDSFQLLFGVMTGLALLRAALVTMPPKYKMAIISAFMVLHFFGILLATTSPQPTPWMVDQLYRRAYEPYLQFVYLRNAYHFYSPDPGPASIMACLLKTEDGEEVSADGIRRKKYRMEWVVTPKRPEDVKDPLGVTYYRRLSLTDQIGHVNNDVVFAAEFERSGIRRRRSNSTIPLLPNQPVANQYQLPYPVVTRFFLPSYAQHLLMDLPEQDRVKTTVKIYRIVHHTLPVLAFVGNPRTGEKTDPYDPTTFAPYFLGEFGFVNDPKDPSRLRVELLDPQAEMLYWLVPIVPRQGGAIPGDPAQKGYVDHLSAHAGREFEWSKLR